MSNQPSLSQLIADVVAEKGLAIVIVLFVMFLGYQYFNIQLAHMESDHMDLMQRKGYSLRGSARMDTVKSELVIDLSLEVVKKQ